MRFFGFILFLLSIAVVAVGVAATYDVGGLGFIARFIGADTSVDTGAGEYDKSEEHDTAVDEDSGYDDDAVSYGVHLSGEVQAQSGLRIETLHEVEFTPELKAFGRVMDVGPMVVLRLRYDKARLSGSKALLSNIRIQSELLWGAELTKEILDGGGRLFDSIVRGKAVLMQVTLPFGESLEHAAPARFYRNGEPDDPIPAEYISPSPQTDPMIQGETHFYRAAAIRLRIGMAVDAAVTRRGEPLAGVLAPESAVVWHGGQAWVYLRTGDETFSRVTLPTEYKTADGWFAPRPQWAGSDLVMVGAQMLLSEEFRAHLGDDDDD